MSINPIALSDIGKLINNQFEIYKNRDYNDVEKTKEIKTVITEILEENLGNYLSFNGNDLTILEKTKKAMQASNRRIMKAAEEEPLNDIAKVQKQLNDKIIELAENIIIGVRDSQNFQPFQDVPNEVVDIILSDESLTKADIHNAMLVDKKFSKSATSTEQIVDLINNSKKRNMTIQSAVELYDLLNKYGKLIAHLDLRSLLGNEMQYINGATIVQILKKCPNLKSLDLGGCTRGIDLDNISKFLSSSLESLTFDKTKIHNFQHIIAMIEKLPNLKFLSLAGCVESEGRNITIAESHVPISNLESLSLSKCKAFDVNALSVLVRLFPNLKHLNIANVGPGRPIDSWGGDVHTLAELIETCLKLEHLTVTLPGGHTPSLDTPVTFKEIYRDRYPNSTLIIEHERGS